MYNEILYSGALFSERVKPFVSLVAAHYGARSHFLPPALIVKTRTFGVAPPTPSWRASRRQILLRARQRFFSRHSYRGVGSLRSRAAC